MSMITKQALEAFKTKRFSGRVQCSPDASRHNMQNTAKIRAIFISITLLFQYSQAYLKYLQISLFIGHYGASVRED